MAIILLFFLGWIIAILILIVSIDIKQFGLFKQLRIGKYGKPFTIYKIRTLTHNFQNNITVLDNSRITTVGKFIRKSKLDELPQLINILKGDMSFVGPRPDVKGYADQLKGDDRIILSVKPGITSPATLKYRNEEFLLAEIIDPKKYNDEVIWPDKVKINKEYIRNWSFKKDLLILYKTIFK